MIYPYPQPVFRYFAALAAIPHGSGNTAQIRDWCVDTAKALGAEAYADAAGNVIVRAAASPGYEDHPGVILQGHMDMVCAQLPTCGKNMETEGLDLQWGKDYLTADGTTLGGDDGIALAYAFAVLSDPSVLHPPLTVIITRDEETGMDGATGLSPEELTGTYLINIDSEEEGIFTVGCAGGVRTHLHYPAKTAPVSGTQLTLTLSGLRGGHSGAEIHKPLLNANAAMIRMLNAVSVPVSLCGFAGGIRDNVIPTECRAELTVQPDDVDEVLREIEAAFRKIYAEYPGETGVTLTADQDSDVCREGISAADTKALIGALAQLPNGVQAMNEALQMPETSLNLGIMEWRTDHMYVDALIRSGINAEKYALADRVQQLCESAGGSVTRSGDYPAWEYQPDTELLTAAVAAFRERYGKNPVVTTIHAGLECGILSDKAEGLQCISVGPDIHDIHTPREALSITSVGRTWDFLRSLLEAL